MNLHEYQAKALLRDRGIPIPRGAVASTPEEARARAEELGGDSWVVKAQVHAGQRGKAGGVKIVDSLDAVAAAAKAMLGKRIVTGHTGREGLAVRNVYVEEACKVAREIYAAVLVDRREARVSVIIAREGGAAVEDRLALPENLIDAPVGPDGLDAAGINLLAGELEMSADRAALLGRILAQARNAFIELDASLIEFNPLAVTESGDFAALDVKMVLDDNALARHPELQALRDEDEVDPQEREADRFELNYARLDGNIGLMTTGAGLGLAAIDMIVEEGGEAANFMDVRPMASRDQVAEGIMLLLRDSRVRVVMVVAMGGGILHCDTIAEGIAAAYRKSATAIPVVFHAAGTGKEISELTLRNQGIPVAFADSIGEAAREAVRIAGSAGG